MAELETQINSSQADGPPRFDETMQPMESAPRNGTRILAWDGKLHAVVEFTEYINGDGNWREEDDAKGPFVPLGWWPVTAI